MNPVHMKAYLTEVLGWKMTPVHFPSAASEDQDQASLNDKYGAHSATQSENGIIAENKNPQAVSPTQTGSSRQLYGVYAGTNSLEPAEKELLTKMLKAIGQDSFQWIDSDSEFGSFDHILNFSTEDSGEFNTQPGVRLWSFEPLFKYIEGSQSEVTSFKKEAWEKLKQFRAEVLS